MFSTDSTPSDFIITSQIQDKDIIFKGDDGGSQFTALTLDMSAAGAATFNDKITAVGTSVFTNLDISGDIDIDGTTNLDVVDIDGAVDMATTAAIGTFLTFGGGVATDAGLKFDGNAVDFYFGLDDSTDKLTLGANSQTYGNAVAFTLDENGKFTLPDNVVEMNVSGNQDNLILSCTDADANSGPNLRMYRNSDNPADDDVVGRIDFEGVNNANQDVIYANIQSEIMAVADGSEDGQLQFGVMKSGTLRNALMLDRTEVVINEDSVDMNFRVESSGLTHALFVDGGTNRVGIGTSTPDTLLEVQGAATVGGGADETLQQWNVGSDNCKAGLKYLDGSGNRGFNFGTITEHDFNIKTNDTNRLKVTYEGNAVSQFTARAWFNIDGSGTDNLRDSHNVSGITDQGVGRYTIAIGLNMANINYSVVVSGNGTAGNSYGDSWGNTEKTSPAISSLAVGEFNINSAPAGSYMDQDLICGIVFGD